MNTVTFNEGNNFKKENISTPPSSNNNLVILQDQNMSNNSGEKFIKPELNNNFSINENKRVKINPML